MTYFKKDLCEKLVEMGCMAGVIESDNIFGIGFYYSETELCLHDELSAKALRLIPAFIEQDFTGSSEQARKNAEIVWHGRHVLEDGGGYFRDTEKYKVMRHELIDSDNPEQLIRDAVGLG